MQRFSFNSGNNNAEMWMRFVNQLAAHGTVVRISTDPESESQFYPSVQFDAIIEAGYNPNMALVRAWDRVNDRYLGNSESVPSGAFYCVPESIHIY